MRAIGRRYEAHKPAAEMVVILVKTVDEARTRSESMADIIAVQRTENKGIDVFG